LSVPYNYSSIKYIPYRVVIIPHGQSEKQKNDKPSCSLSSNNTTIMASLSLAGLKVEEEEDDYESEYALRCIYIFYIKTTYSTLTQYFITSTKHYTCGRNINIKRS
jgi:hypothetical protein